MLRFWLVVGAGGAGCGLRYLIGLWLGSRSFPYATLVVNLVGSFAIALVLELSLRLQGGLSDELRLALTTGFMGGLTTYSSFNYETTALAQRGQVVIALANVGITLLGCLVMGAAGLWVARRLASS
jgi:fluoride exporter